MPHHSLVKVRSLEHVIYVENRLRISNHQIKLVVTTEQYTDWWRRHRQRRTRNEIEAEERRG